MSPNGTSPQPEFCKRALMSTASRDAIAHAHPGLINDRFFGRYVKKEHLNALGITESAHAWPLPTAVRWPSAEIQRIQSRQKAFISRFEHKQTLDLTCTGRLITGTGREHPSENGFTFHPVWGVPYLGGAQVKGLVRAWVETDPYINETLLRQRLMRWFGSEVKHAKAGSLQAGEVELRAGDYVFLDALPTQAPSVVWDVLTPHMGNWYASGDTEKASQPDVVPADWHSPVPVDFLAVEGLCLRFAVAIRPGLTDDALKQAEQDLPTVMDMLKDALIQHGAGAKTAVGYGRFSTDAPVPVAEPGRTAGRAGSVTLEQDTEIARDVTLVFNPSTGQVSATIKDKKTSPAKPESLGLSDEQIAQLKKRKSLKVPAMQISTLGAMVSLVRVWLDASPADEA